MDLGTTVTREGAIYTPLEPPCWLVDLGLVLSFYKKWFKTIYWIMNLFTNMMRKSLHKFDHLAQKAEPTLRSKKKWTLGPISCCTAVPALRAIYQRDVRRITRGLAIASSELAGLFFIAPKASAEGACIFREVGYYGVCMMGILWYMCNRLL